MIRRLKRLELTGFKSFAKKTTFLFDAPITAIVGPNGSGKSNCAEAFRWVLGERSLKSLRGSRGEDLLFGGPAGSRLNRAAVEVVFDNTDRQFNLDFPEVSIKREVYRDSTTAYFLNGTAVRFRRVAELLAEVALGTAEHFIINQGEADQILRASELERQQMVEDALGLRLYHLKIEASEKKLAQTEANIVQVQSLRREIAPHLRFLEKQVERIRQADRLRGQLEELYGQYLRREEMYLTGRRQYLESVRAEPAAARAQLGQELAKLSGAQTFSPPPDLAAAEAAYKQLARRRSELTRRLGNLEGKLEAVERSDEAPAAFGAEAVVNLGEKLRRFLTEAAGLTAIDAIKAVLVKMRQALDDFFRQPRPAGSLVETWRRQHQELVAELKRNEEADEAAAKKQQQLLKSFEQRLAEVRRRDEEIFARREKKQEYEARLRVLEVEAEKLAVEEENFRRELDEGRVLIGQKINDYRRLPPPENLDEPRAKQAERRRQVERLKIKLEDSGGESVDTLKEYREAAERDQFLAKEIADLENSAATIKQLIADLRLKLENDFQAGLAKINRYFEEFIRLMFGGGEAVLRPARRHRSEETVEAEDEESPTPEALTAGLDVKVNLPRKKIKNLMMLSGGERSLVSIALLFALSQVSPPPFLVLDETDATLDEANSRKYADLVEDLAKRSQLILITHNRETMSRALAIYGLTMGADGVSQLLSIKFDQAVTYAKL